MIDQNRPEQKAPYKTPKHQFHILRPSTLPLLTGFFLFCAIVPIVFWMHGISIFGLPLHYLSFINFVALVVTILRWFFRVLKESSRGHHTPRVQKGLRLGMLLFIASEVMFFFAFFWAFFHYSLVPSPSVGGVWPPAAIQPISPWGLPLINTLLLLASGVTITVAHAHVLKFPAPEHASAFFRYLFFTIILGVVFLICQGYEYAYGVEFSWEDNAYASTFFITTGFHGLHVTLGVMALIFNWVRHGLATILPNYLAPRISDRPESSFAADLSKAFQYRFGYNYLIARRWALLRDEHFGFEAAAWYWHFVDVVWLFLFLTIYWWGGSSK